VDTFWRAELWVEMVEYVLMVLTDDSVVVTWATFVVNCPTTPGIPPKIPPPAEVLEPEPALTEVAAAGSSPEPWVFSGTGGSGVVSEGTGYVSVEVMLISVDGSRVMDGKSSGDGSKTVEDDSGAG